MMSAVVKIESYEYIPVILACLGLFLFHHNPNVAVIVGLLHRRRWSNNYNNCHYIDIGSRLEQRTIFHLILTMWVIRLWVIELLNY